MRQRTFVVVKIIEYSIIVRRFFETLCSRLAFVEKLLLFSNSLGIEYQTLRVYLFLKEVTRILILDYLLLLLAYNVFDSVSVIAY